jgi:hypothetical protein
VERRGRKQLDYLVGLVVHDDFLDYMCFVGKWAILNNFINA